MPNVIDREIPNECQYIKEWEVWEAQECQECGKVFDEEDVLECDVCKSRDFHMVEIVVED